MGKGKGHPGFLPQSSSCSPQTLSRMLAIPLMAKGDSRSQQGSFGPFPQPCSSMTQPESCSQGWEKGSVGAEGPKKKPLFSLWARSGEGAAASGGRDGDSAGRGELRHSTPSHPFPGPQDLPAHCHPSQTPFSLVRETPGSQ